jgi:hypothetical protein
MDNRFNIGSSGQQVHVALGANLELDHKRHPCFKLENKESLIELQHKIWKHFEAGGAAAPLAIDKPGEANSGMFLPTNFLT